MLAGIRMTRVGPEEREHTLVEVSPCGNMTRTKTKRIKTELAGWAAAYH